MSQPDSARPEPGPGADIDEIFPSTSVSKLTRQRNRFATGSPAGGANLKMS